MRKQFMVQVHNSKDRLDFYNYIHENYDLEEHFTSFEEITMSKFPFIVDFDDKSFWICNSITCCACAAQKNLILSVEDFKKKITKKTPIILQAKIKYTKIREKYRK